MNGYRGNVERAPVAGRRYRRRLLSVTRWVLRLVINDLAPTPRQGFKFEFRTEE
jgi:hypothetical protein